uniref:Battenin n=1 Tax=Heterorhabditis bacteriophora TaxID=37862 RepID=A0A1I7XP62_HETBA
MKTYRWHLLNYQIWAASIDILMNCLFQPVSFLPLIAITGRGVLITNFGFSTFACFVMYFAKSPVCSSSFNSGIVLVPPPVHCQETEQQAVPFLHFCLILCFKLNCKCFHHIV